MNGPDVGLVNDAVPDLSFIVPAYNEEQEIINLIKSVRSTIIDINYEIIVVDNGSVDGTSDNADACGAKVVSIPKSTISTARNTGVEKAGAEVVAFLDADVRVTRKWGLKILSKLENIRKELLFTGSRYVIPKNPSWIERSWFEPLSKRNASYINGGNMVISKKTFQYAGGFNEDLETGEDYEFSSRAIKKGVSIDIDSDLEAIHDGYPKTILGFCRREVWHGKGDFQTVSNILHSKVSILAIVFAVLNILAVAAFVLGGSFVLAVALTGVVILCAAMSLYIFHANGIRYVVVNIPLCYLYLLSRSFSFISVLADTIARPVRKKYF